MNVILKISVKYGLIIFYALSFIYLIVLHSQILFAQTSVMPEVDIAKPKIHPIIEWDHFTGRFRAVEFVNVRSRVSGHLEKVLFKDGQYVKKGDLLFVIDQKPFLAALSLNRGQLELAKAELAFAKKQLERSKTLSMKNIISKSSYDEAIFNYNSAKAKLAIAQGRLEQTKLNLKYAEIHSPISGQMSRALVTKGNLIIGGDMEPTLLTKVVTLDPIYFYFEVDEATHLKYQRLLPGERCIQNKKKALPVEVKLMDEKAFQHRGSLDFIDNSFDESTGSVTYRARIDNSDKLIEPGQFGKVRIPGSNRYEAFLIPDKFILVDQTKYFVYIVDKQNVIQRKYIQVGPLVDGYRVIRKGLDKDTSIAVSQIQKLHPGLKVNTTRVNIVGGKHH